MTKRALQKRLKSLEEKLGLLYIPPMGKYDGDEHVSEYEDFGFWSDIKKMIKEWQAKKEKKNK